MVNKGLILKSKNKTKLWRVTLKTKIGLLKKPESFLVEADGYSKTDIIRIMKEVHPEWEISEINPEIDKVVNSQLSSAG